MNETLKKFMDACGIPTVKKEKPIKSFSTLSTSEKWSLVEALLRDLGYID